MYSQASNCPFFAHLSTSPIMKIFRNILTGILILIAFLAVLSYFLPSEVRVERDIWVDVPINSARQYAPHLNQAEAAGSSQNSIPEIVFEEVGKRTRVSLTLTTQLGTHPFAKYRGLVLDASLGAHIERGLADFAEQVMAGPVGAMPLQKVDSFASDSLNRAVARK